ncbi:MAG: hypothetical protein MUO26_01005 [Methanotrichaceae archaeon]|nr:hypothetical protein [Methanotrichaceae archaeon]
MHETLHGSGQKCDLPHPLFLVAIHGKHDHNFTEPFIQKCKSLAKAENLYVDMKDGQIRLAWKDCDGSTNKVAYIDRVEAVRLGISYDSLSDAVSEGGGAIDIDGHYPVTNGIIRSLRKVGLRK